MFKYSFPEAAYDSQTQYRKPGGSPDARELVVKEVLEWIDSGSTNICWIYGAPGTGKTPIMQEIATQCARKGTLGASFFFFKNVRTSSARLVSSIAYQLVVSAPEKRLQIGEVVETDASVLEKPLSVQMQKLVVSPLLPNVDETNETAHPRPTVPPVIVVIDGVDHCIGAENQREVVRIIEEASKHQQLPILWLIACRPEDVIRKSFEAITPQPLSISLADVERLLESQRQVSMLTYLRNRFNESYEKNPSRTAGVLTIALPIFGLLYWIYIFPLLLRLAFAALALLGYIVRQVLCMSKWTNI